MDAVPASSPPPASRAGPVAAAGLVQPAACRRRTGLRDGRHRRHHPADRERPVDHRVEADQRRRPAAHPRRLGPRVHALPGDPAISRGRRAGRNDAVRLQVHLLLGMDPPPARPDPRPRLLRRESPGSRSSGPFPRGSPGGLRHCSSLAERRARSAGSWSCQGSKAGPRSAPTACLRTCYSPCSCSRR